MTRAIMDGHRSWASRIASLASLVVMSIVLAACGAATTKTPTGPGVTSTTITLGATLPLTGTAATNGLGAAAGENAYVKYINSHGGVKGRKIKLILLDDQYVPSTAVTQMHLLVEQDHIFAVAGGAGTPATLANVPFLTSSGIPVIGPFAPSNTLGTMATPNIYVLTPNYIQEFKDLAHYVYTHSHITTYSLVGVTGSVDQNALQGMQEGLSGTGATVHNVPEVAGTSNMAPLAEQLLGYDAKAVFLILTSGDTANLLEAMNRIGYHPKLASSSAGVTQAEITQFGSIMQGLILMEERLQSTSHAPGVQQMVKQYKAVTGSVPNTYNELGWVQAEVTVAALKAAKSLSWSSLEQALNGMRNFQTGVIPPISFGARNRQGVDAIALGEVRGDGLVQLSGFTAP